MRPKSTHTRTVGREARAHGWGPWYTREGLLDNSSIVLAHPLSTPRSPFHPMPHEHLCTFIPGTDASTLTILGTMKYKGARRHCSPLPRYKCARIGPGIRQNGVNQGLCSTELTFYALAAESCKHIPQTPACMQHLNSGCTQVLKQSQDIH